MAKKTKKIGNTAIFGKRIEGFLSLEAKEDTKPPMKKVAILAIEKATSFSVMGSLDMLSKVNSIGSNTAEEGPYFQPLLVGTEDRLVKSSSGHPFYCDRTIATNERYDLIIIPSCDGDIHDTVENNLTLVPWLKQQHRDGAHIASMCTGSFLLCKTGLLDGKTATTHWAYATLFQQLYPQVSLKISENIADHGTLVSAGGGTSFINLIMYLIEKYYGHELAVLCSKIMLADLDKMPQSTYSIFTAYKQHGDQAILQAQEYIEENYEALISLTLLAKEVALSERTLIRRFKKATGLTPTTYVQQVRVEAAKKLLEQSQDTILSIMDDVGYADLANFRNVFKKHVGISLHEYRKKFKAYS